MSLRSEIAQLDHSISVVSRGRSMLEHASSTLQEASALFTRAREVAVEGADATLDQDGRTALAQQADALLDRLIALVNEQHGNRSLFGGSQTGAPAFEAVEDSTGRTIGVRYNGGDAAVRAEVAPGVSVTLNEAGSNLFQRRERGATTFVGETGAAPGQGTDSGVGVKKLEVVHTSTIGYAATGAAAGSSPDTHVGNVTLTLTHTTTDYSAAVTGITAGASSASDTILGDHTITVDTVAGTIQLNSGPAVAIAGTADQALTDGVHTVYVDTRGPLSGGTDTVRGGGTLSAGGATAAVDFSANQEIKTATGASIFVDTTTVHLAGAEGLTAQAAMTIDGGATYTPVTFAADQAVTHSLLGPVTHVDTSGVTRTGVEAVEYAGTLDAFEVLIHLRDALENDYGQATADQLTAVQETLDPIADAQDALLGSMATMGVRVQRLESAEGRLTSLHLSATEALSQAEDADVGELVVEMTSQENAFQAALAASAKMAQISLLDFM